MEEFMNKEIAQTEGIKKILEWMEKCPMECEISSMQGSTVHMKISSSLLKEKKKEKEKIN